MSTFNLKVTNNYSSPTVFAIFQEGPEGSDLFTLAWMCKYVPQGTTATFHWEIEYNAVWSQPGEELVFGTVCDTSNTTGSLLRTASTTASQSVVVDIESKNTTITLSYTKDYNAYSFGQLEQSSIEDVIYTNSDISVPNYNEVAANAVVGVGIGMSGYGLFLAGGQPNKKNEWTINAPKYYLITGDYKTGEILDVDHVKKQALEIPYNGSLSRSAVLNNQNTLTLVD